MKNIGKILSYYHNTHSKSGNNLSSISNNLHSLSPLNNLNLLNSNIDNTSFTNLNSPNSNLYSFNNNPNSDKNLKSSLKSTINTLTNKNQNIKKQKSLKKDNKNNKKLGEKSDKVSFFDLQNENNKKAILNLKQRLKNNNPKKNNDDDDSIKIIDKLLNKIKEKSKEKNHILSSIKEKQEIQLKQLKQEKNQISEKKLKFSIEKKRKEKEKLSHFRDSNRNSNNQLGLGKWNYKTKKDLIPLQISPNYEKPNDNTKNSVNDLNYLSDPIKTSKENNLISLKHNFKNRKESELPYYNPSNIVDYNNNSNTINNNSFKSNYLKNSNQIINNMNELKLDNKLKSRNIHRSTDRNYLDILKEDMKELNERQNCRIHTPSNEIGVKKNVKDYIMPVNDMDDVIEINYIFKSLGPAFGISNQLKK